MISHSDLDVLHEAVVSAVHECDRAHAFAVRDGLPIVGKLETIQGELFAVRDEFSVQLSSRNTNRNVEAVKLALRTCNSIFTLWNDLNTDQLENAADLGGRLSSLSKVASQISRNSFSPGRQ